MGTLSYRVGDLKRLIKESSQEFEAKLGPNVKSDNKSNNEKSYKEAEKRAKDYDGGLTDRPKGKLPDKMDGNKTTLDYNPMTEPNQEYKDKVKAQAKGYTSTLEEKNNIDKSGEFDNDSKIYDNFSKAGKEMDKNKSDLEHSGLVTSKMPKKEKNRLSENKAKRLTFKTRFINESHMLQRIPDEYKRDGQKIYMRDIADNEYIVECTANNAGVIETNILSYNNKNLMNEQVDRIHALMNYTQSRDFGPASNTERINESRGFKDIMDIARGKKTVL